MATDAKTRRRGETLRRAIHAATLAEIAEAGYAALTMDGVAERAGTGKAALYRRWPSKRELVLDAIRTALPDPYAVEFPGTLRADLLTLVAVMNEAMGARPDLPGAAMIGELFHDPELRAALREKVLEPRLALLERLLRTAVDRGEIGPDAVTPLVVRTAPALVFQGNMLEGRRLRRGELEQIVDEVLLPLLRGRSADTGEG